MSDFSEKFVRYANLYEKFNGDIHFCHISIFDPFLGTLVVKRVQRGLKNNQNGSPGKDVFVLLTSFDVAEPTETGMREKL